MNFTSSENGKFFNMKANIGLSDANAQAVGLLLNGLLADEQVLYHKVRNYHWNVTGTNMIELHKFYEAQYTELADVIDDTAERIRKVGHFAMGRMEDYLKLASLLEGESTSERVQQWTNLLNDHETLVREIKQKISTTEQYNDPGTVDFLTNVLKVHEKWAWMIRAYLS